MSRLTRWLDERAYPSLGDDWDATLFREIVLSRMATARTVLDLGAGAGIIPQLNLRGLGPRICGVDPDPRVLENPFVDEARIGRAEAIPYQDASFDLVVSFDVLEHLPAPRRALGEAFRVLRPGGALLVKTPNRFHYAPALARLTPHVVHRKVNVWRGRREENTFPTLFRANSAGTLRRLAAAIGFEVEEIHRIEGRPEYLRWTTPTYLVGIAYERVVNATELLAPFRVVLVAAMRKPKTAS